MVVDYMRTCGDDEKPDITHTHIVCMPRADRLCPPALPQVLISWNGITVGIMGFADNWLADVSGITGKDFEFLDIFATAAEVASDLKSRGAEVPTIAVD